MAFLIKRKSVPKIHKRRWKHNWHKCDYCVAGVLKNKKRKIHPIVEEM